MDVDDTAPILDGNIGKRAEQAANACIVDGKVQRTKSLQDFRENLFVRVELGDIARESEGRTARFADLRRCRLGEWAVDIDDHDRRTAARQLEGSRCPHPAARSRDERDFVLEAIMAARMR